MDNDADDAERKLQFYLTDIESFEQNLVWKEIIETVTERMTITSHELRTETDLNKLLRAQGDMTACEFFLVQTALLKQAVEDQLKEDQLPKESEDVE